MSMYLNAFIMLGATVGGIVVLARVLQALRAGPKGGLFRVGLKGGLKGSGLRTLAVEEACALDGKRRLVLVRCGEQRVVLLTGGPSDLVVSVLPGEAARGLVVERAA